MNKDTRTIMQLLGVDEQTALMIQNKMGENGLDFSECDQWEFNHCPHSIPSDSPTRRVLSVKIRQIYEELLRVKIRKGRPH